MTENLSTETLVGAETNVPAANGGVTVETPALTLAELNATLGSTFKDAPTALRALKDTQSYVGKRKEDIASELKPSDVASKSDIQSLKSDLFYSQNPQYKPYAEMLGKLSTDPAEAVNNPVVKELIEKASKADEVEQSRSIVSSNSRLSEQKSIIDTAVEVANRHGSTQEDVALVFARSINADNNS